MQLFYNPDLTKDSTQITFDKIESKHIVRVLRKKEEAVLHITNGKGYLFDAKIIDIQEKPKPWNYYLHIAIAPTKNNDRIEWFLEKATEIGIDEITPLICNNSERRFIKLERFEKIVQSAMKQSLKFTLPKINEPVKFNEFINQTFEGKVCIAHCEDDQKQLLQSVTNLNEKTTILIGPEGDFSKQEIEKALDKKCIPISLGESRLRTETAGLVAVNTISFIYQ